MKLILIIFHADKEGMLHELLNKIGTTGFTTWGPVYSKGRHSEPRMGTHVWSGENRILTVAISDEGVYNLLKVLKLLAETREGEEIKVFELNGAMLI